MSTLLVLLVALPLAAALSAVALGAREAERAGRLTAAASGASFLLAVALLTTTIADEPVSLGTLLYADTLSAVLLTLVTAVGAIVLVFGRGYLRADAAQTQFFAAASVLVSATAAMVAAGTLVGLTAAWVVSSVALVTLLGMYSNLPAARAGTRRTALTFLLADAALITAAALATTTWGTIELRELAARSAEFSQDGAAITVVACLLVVAAVGRSAQLPLQGWLPATLAAPTPVSALLHAGVVNAGGVLLVKLSPIFGASSLATHVAFTIGAATALYGTALMLTKTDIKGTLAHSTMGQMGFMVMTCGLGAFAAAIFHLVAHGLYKATLFLGSGSAVARGTRERKAPHAKALTVAQRRTVVAAGLLAPSIAVGTGMALLYSDMSSKPGGIALAAFAWVTGAWLMMSWAGRNPALSAMAGAAAALTVVTLAYLSAIAGFTTLLAPSLTGAGTNTVSPWLLLVPAAIMVIGSVMVRTRGGHAAHHLTRRLYVAVQSAGYVHQHRSPDGLGGYAVRRPTLRWALQPQGGRS